MYAFFFFFNDPATTEIYTLSLHDALPICPQNPQNPQNPDAAGHSEDCEDFEDGCRSEEHTSELQSRLHLVCRLLLEKKKKKSKFSLFVIKTNIHILVRTSSGASGCQYESD